jgi:hypothetical protein
MSQKIGRRRREAAQLVSSVNPWNSLDIIREQLAPYEPALRLDLMDIAAERGSATCDEFEVVDTRIMDVLAHRAAGPSSQPMSWPGERRPFERNALPKAYRARPDLMFEECYLQCLNFNLAGGRVFNVGDGLVQQMAATENNAPTGEFRLPFDAFVLTSQSETLARLFLNRNDMLASVRPSDVSISVMVSIGENAQGVRRLTLLTHASRAGQLIGMATARIGLVKGTVRETVEDFLRIGRNEPVTLDRNGDEMEGGERMNWFGKAGAGYYLTLVNVLLYLTTPSASARRVRVTNAIAGESRETREVGVVGEDLKPIVLEPGRLVEALSAKGGTRKEFHLNGRVMTRGHWRSLRGQASLPNPEQQWIRPYWRGLDQPERPQKPYSVLERSDGR